MSEKRTMKVKFVIEEGRRYPKMMRDGENVCKCGVCR